MAADYPLFQPKADVPEAEPLIFSIMPTPEKPAGAGADSKTSETSVPSTGDGSSKTGDDTHKGMVVGEKTYGKAVAQSDGTIQMPGIDATGWPSEANDKATDKPELSKSQQAILDAAKENVGKQIWNFGPNAEYTKNGELGGATSVAAIADAVGFKGIESASVRGVREALDKQFGFTEKPLSQAKPGDIYVDSGAGRSFIGVVGENNKMYMIDRQGTWRERPIMPTSTARAWSPKDASKN